MDERFASDNIIDIPSQAELEEIDALLSRAANEESAQVNFDAIKARVYSAAESRKSRRRHISSYIAAAACILFCLGVIGSAMHIDKMRGFWAARTETPSPDAPDDPSTPDVSILSSGEPNHITKVTNSPDPFTGDNQPNSYSLYMAVGTSNNEAIANADLFPATLPTYMTRYTGSGSQGSPCNFASGQDCSGAYRYFDCSIIDYAPYKLEDGYVGVFMSDSDYVFYWQYSAEHCLRVRFFGFSREEAQKLFYELISCFDLNTAMPIAS